MLNLYGYTIGTASARMEQRPGLSHAPHAHQHNGRQGNVRLINGRSEPELTIAAGQIERWRIVNASSARYVRLSLGGLPFQIIGTDGGLIEAPVTAEEVLLPAADRVDLAVGPFESDGDVLGIDDLPYNRMAGKKGVERFGTIRIGPRQASSARVPPRLREIAPLVTGTASATRPVKLGFKPSLRRGFDFVINGERHHHDEPVNVGELQVCSSMPTGSQMTTAPPSPSTPATGSGRPCTSPSSQPSSQAPRRFAGSSGGLEATTILRSGSRYF